MKRISTIVFFLLMIVSVSNSFALTGPSLIYPQKSMTGLHNEVNFNWSDVPNSVYEIQISGKNDFSDIVFSQSGINSNSLKVSLESSKHYFWRVRAISSAISNWSEAWSFKTVDNTVYPKTKQKSSKNTDNKLSMYDLRVPYDAGFQLAMYGNDDGSTGEIPLQFSFNFFGTYYTSVYINNNGNISFGSQYSSYDPVGFPSNEYVMIAPFWADVDTRSCGEVYYKSEPNRFTVIWNNVGCYGRNCDKLNTFEVIITDGTDPTIGLGNTVMFSFDQIQWTTGDASEGVDGFGGIPATCGLNL